MTGSWKYEVEVDNKWYQSGPSYDTKEDAQAAGQRKFDAWYACTDVRVVEITLEVE
jgi:hypothetical protein